MTIQKSIIHHSVARIAFLISSFVLNLLFARLLLANGVASLYYTINTFSMISLVLGLSIESAMTFYVAKGTLDEKELVSLSVVWSFVAGLLAFLIITIAAQFSPREDFYESPIRAVVFVTGSLLTTYASALFYAKKDFFLPYFIPAIVNLAIGAALAWAHFTHAQDYISTLIDIYFLSFLISGLLILWQYVRSYKLASAWHWPSSKTIKQLAEYSSLAFITNIISFLALRIDYFILNWFGPRYVTATALGNYIQVNKILQVLLIVPTILATIVFPMSATTEQELFKKDLKKLIGRAFVIAMLFCVLISAIGRWLFPFVFGDSFEMMYLCFLYSVPALLSITIVRILSAHFAGQDKVIYNFWGSLIALVVVSSLNFVFVPLMGINGAAAADSVGYVCYLCLLGYLFLKVEKQ